MLAANRIEICDDLDETWGSDFDDDVEEEILEKVPITGGGDLYEIPDGKPMKPLLVKGSTGSSSSIPEWLKKVEALHGVFPPGTPSDENAKPQAAVYIENVLLPTRATKDDESKNFIEALKRKLSQKNLLAGHNNGPKPCSGSGNNRSHNNQIIPNLGRNGLKSHPPIERLGSVEIEGIKKIKESVQKFPWFYRVDRNKAELILENYTADGSFLMRECHHGGPNVPFTLTIRYALRLFHIQIRVRPDSQFALGSAKLNEIGFQSIQEMIDTYRKTPLQLHTSGKYFGETKLTNPPIVYSFSK